MTASVQLIDAPSELARTVLRHDHWDVPNRILDAVFTPNARVAVKACHASSKTFTSADAVLLSLLLGGDVITTAPTWTQVEQVLWGSVRRALEDSVIPLREWGDINRTAIRLATGEFAIGLSTDQSVRFQGYHSRQGSFLLVVMDEAPGVLPGIYEAIAGISAGGDVRQLLIGNPVISSGPFYDIFANASPGWERFTIDAFDTPNFHDCPEHPEAGRDARGMCPTPIACLRAMPEHALDVASRPYLVTRRWVRDRLDEWGEDHPLWQSRVRGQFPLQSEDALLSLAWLEAAGNREAVYVKGEPIVAGIDVAGPGEDETVLAIRQGSRLLALMAFAHADARGEVVAALRPWKDLGPLVACVDTAGIGHYFAQSLKDAGYTVREINVGESPMGTDAEREKYKNLKAQLYWSFRERCAEGDLAGLTDRTAVAQLAGIRYRHDGRGRVEIESKDDARKRGVRSPDRAEAIVLAFAPDDPRAGLAAVVGRTAPIVYGRAAPAPGPFGPTRDEMEAERLKRARENRARRRGYYRD